MQLVLFLTAPDLPAAVVRGSPSRPQARARVMLRSCSAQEGAATVVCIRHASAPSPLPLGGREGDIDPRARGAPGRG